MQKLHLHHRLAQAHITDSFTPSLLPSPCQPITPSFLGKSNFCWRRIFEGYTTDGEVFTWGQATSHLGPADVSLYSQLPSGLGHGDLADKLVPTPHSGTMLFSKTVNVQ